MKKCGSKIYKDIKKAVAANKLQQPFTVADVNNACNGLLSKSPSFLSKHRLDNPGGYCVYFIRISEGKYEVM